MTDFGHAHFLVKGNGAEIVVRNLQLQEGEPMIQTQLVQGLRTKRREELEYIVWQD